MEFFAAVIFVVVVAMVISRFDRRHREHLDAWAARNGYTLIDVRQPFFGRPRFFLYSAAQRIYRFRAVHDATHEHRSGAAKVGGYFLGAMTPQVDVRWDE